MLDSVIYSLAFRVEVLLFFTTFGKQYRYMRIFFHKVAEWIFLKLSYTYYWIFAMLQLLVCLYYKNQ